MFATLLLASFTTLAPLSLAGNQQVPGPAPAAAPHHSVRVSQLPVSGGDPAYTLRRLPLRKPVLARPAAPTRPRRGPKR